MARKLSVIKRTNRCLILALLTCNVLPATAQITYDVVIENGRVMDPETGLDGIRNIGISGQTIAAISVLPMRGTTTVDASGLVVAPGFIDLHAHGQTARANEFQAMDGVTTALELEGGVGDVGQFDAQRSTDAVINFGASVSHAANRTWAMPEYASEYAAAIEAFNGASGADREDAGQRVEAAAYATLYEGVDPAHYATLWDALEKQLQAGGLGIGVPHQYYPGASYDEIFRVFQFAAGQDVPIYTHVREMGVAPMQEVIANSAATGASLHIVHMNSSSLWDYQTNLELILGAQERGVDVTTEAYPYTAASTSIESAIFDQHPAAPVRVDSAFRMRICSGRTQANDSRRKRSMPIAKKAAS